MKKLLNIFILFCFLWVSACANYPLSDAERCARKYQIVSGTSLGRSRTHHYKHKQTEYGYWINEYAGSSVNEGNVVHCREPLNKREEIYINNKIESGNRKIEKNNENEKTNIIVSLFFTVIGLFIVKNQLDKLDESP